MALLALDPNQSSTLGLIVFIEIISENESSDFIIRVREDRMQQSFKIQRLRMACVGEARSRGMIHKIQEKCKGMLTGIFPAGTITLAPKAAIIQSHCNPIHIVQTTTKRPPAPPIESRLNLRKWSTPKQFPSSGHRPAIRGKQFNPGNRPGIR